MDFAFAPGSTRYDRYMRRLFTYKANTANVTARDIQAAVGNFLSGRLVEDFVLYLDIHQADEPGEFPPDQIYIASHSNASGWMEIDLDPSRSFSETTYEAVEWADDNDTIRIPSHVVMDGGIFVTNSIQIKGCNIGKAIPFLQALKTAFGSIPFLQAPKHYHYLSWAYISRGIFEFMMYEFVLYSKERFTSRNDLIAAFQALDLTYIDGSEVPDDQWTRWIPSNFYRRRKQEFNLRVELGETVARLTRINTGREYRHSRPSETFNVPDITSRPDAANHRDLLRTHLLTLDYFQPAHPFPVFQRWGYSNIDDMLDNMNINYTWIREENVLRCNLYRYEYRVLLPVRENGDGNLIFNFHPRTGTTHAAVNNMLESDTRLFATV